MKGVGRGKEGWDRKWGGGFSGAGSDNLITFLHEHYVSRGEQRKE